MSNNFVCYIRRNDGNGWVRSRSHHRHALESFLHISVNNRNGEVHVCVPHDDGGNFEATFRRHNIDDIYHEQHVQSMAKYRDDYGRNVDIIMANPGYIAYVNRVTSAIG